VIGVDAADAAGISTRVLDVWTRAGYVRAHFAAVGRPGKLGDLTEAELQALPERWRRNPVNPGQGACRFYSAAEVEVLCRMAQLFRAGFRPDVAARLGRQLAEHPTLSVYAGHDVVLRLLEPHAQADDYGQAYRAVHGLRALSEQLRQLHDAQAEVRS
jgi:hypothetical protein